ncbi:MAG: Smr/MutS family protein [Xanthobacteraceae bacterium]
MSRRRDLSEEERALWGGFARSVHPLQRRQKIDEALPAEEKAAPAPAKHVRLRAGTPPPQTPPLAPLTRRLKQRVARGREPIEAHIDLHGRTQSQAYAALLHFLERAQADGVKIALVVTGKGESRGGDNDTKERGVLRRQVPLWLSLPAFRSLVVGFERAHVGHGGAGALYVHLRRAR